MDAERLIDEITELVFAQLTGGGAPAHSQSSIAELALAALTQQPPAPNGVVPGGQMLVVMGEGRRGMAALPSQLKPHAGKLRVVAVPSEAWPAPRLAGGLGVEAVKVVERPPRDWTELVKGSKVVVVPNLTLNGLAGIALLAGLEPCAAAVVTALVEGTPVVAGCDELNFLSMNAAHLAKPFLDVLRGHVTRVQSLGVSLVEIEKLGEHVHRLSNPQTPVQGTSRGRNVLTRDDVETMLRSGARTIEVAANTIVTPLAREVAGAAGVEILSR